MLKKILFNNNCHFGDIFVCRGIVKWVMENIEAEEYHFCSYHHNRLFLDFPGLKFSKVRDVERSTRWYIEDGVLFINTTYMVGTEYWDDGIGCTIQTLVRALKGELKRILDIDVKGSPVDFLPEIDFSYYNKNNLDKTLAKYLGAKNVMICNNDTKSGQSANWSMDKLITMLADKYPQVVFFVTNFEDKVIRPNVFYTKNILKVEGIDLIENAYVSTKCNVVIGRGSGPFTFSFTRSNLLNKDLKYIELSNGSIDFGFNRISPHKVLSEKVDNHESALEYVHQVFEAALRG